MTTNESRRAIEAILMVAEDPVPPNLLAQLTEQSVARVEELCAELAAAYEAEDRGFVLVRVAGGYRFQSHPDLAPYIERFVLDGKTTRMSAAALETLAIIAYKQPISRAQVASIRGVNVDAVVRTLQQRGYIDEVARDPGPGQAVLYGTTASFLEKLGLDSLDQLPPLADFVPDADVVEQLERGLRGERADDALEGSSTDAPGEASPAPIEPGAAEAQAQAQAEAQVEAQAQAQAEAQVEAQVEAQAEAEAQAQAQVEADPLPSLDGDSVWNHADVLAVAGDPAAQEAEAPELDDPALDDPALDDSAPGTEAAGPRTP
jgi:segregation and condensation protein B